MRALAAGLGALLLASVAGASGAVKAQDPKQFLQAIYAQYVGEGSKGVTLATHADVKRYFAPELAAKLIRDFDSAAKRGDAPELDGDPFIDAQDWQIASFDVAVQEAGSGRATGTVRFKSLDQDRTVKLDLVHLKAGWRIRAITIGGHTLSADAPR